MLEQLLRLPVAAVGSLHRWGNDVYGRVMARFWGFALLYLAALWIGAVTDTRTLTVGAMWLAVFFTVNFYLQPAVLGLFGGIELLRRADDPNRASVVRAGLLVFITVVSAGGLALIAGAIGAGEVFPFAVLAILFIVACASVAGAAKLDLWLKRLAALAAVMLAAATVGALHPAVFVRIGLLPSSLVLSESEKVAAEGAEEHFRAADKATREAIRKRFGGKMEGGTMTPEDWAAVRELLDELKAKSDIKSDPLAAADREIRARRDAKRREWIALIQRCGVAERNVARFSAEQQTFYREKCGGGAAVKGLTTAEVRAKWPELFATEADARSSTPAWLPEFMRDWGPVQWILGTAGGLLLLHLVLAAPFVALLGWLGFRITKKDKKDEGATTGTVVIAGVLALLGAGVYTFSDDLGKWWHDTMECPGCVAAAPFSIGDPRSTNNKRPEAVIARAGYDAIGLFRRDATNPIAFPVKGGAQLRDDVVNVAICATEFCRASDPVSAGDLQLVGNCERLVTLTERTCRGVWTLTHDRLGSFVGRNFTFSLKAYPTSVFIVGYAPDRNGGRQKAFELRLLENLTPPLPR